MTEDFQAEDRGIEIVLGFKKENPPSAGAEAGWEEQTNS